MNPPVYAGAARLLVRRLLAADLPQVMEIERRSFSTPWSLATFRGLLVGDDVDLLAAEQATAERAGELVGYAVCWTVADQAELGNLAVVPEARGSGIGAALVREVQRRVAERQAVVCFLEVRPSNAAGRRLYERFGFVAVGRRPGYYRYPTEDAIIMAWQVPGRLDPSMGEG